MQDFEKIKELTGHVIICGAEESFCTFLEQLRRVEPQRMAVVLLHPSWSTRMWESLSAFGPIFFIRVRALAGRLDALLLYATGLKGPRWGGRGPPRQGFAAKDAEPV